MKAGFSSCTDKFVFLDIRDRGSWAEESTLYQLQSYSSVG